MNILPITPLERQTAELLSQGHTQKMIAKSFHVSPRAIKARVSTLLYKTSSRNSTEIVHKLTKAGFLLLLVMVSGIDDDMRRPTMPRVRVVRPILQASKT